ncbi:hypothetical protein [Priestia megaterium]|uniref:hypothetical protein n=1 Tax=Priestia megaterium TaxID=1404 RepID=UPI0034D79156
MSDCSDILKLQPNMTEIITNKSYDFSSNFLKWFEKATYEEYKRTVGGSTEAQFPIKGIPVGGGADYNEETFKRDQERVKQGSQGGLSTSESVNLISHITNSDTIADAWLKCMIAYKPELITFGLRSEIVENGDDILLTISWIGESNSDVPPKIIDYSIEGATFQTGFPENLEIGPKGYTLILNRNNDGEEVSIVVNTTKGSEKKTLPATNRITLKSEITLKTFLFSYSDTNDYMEFSVPKGYKIIGGGAYNDYYDGNLLPPIISSYPQNINKWYAKTVNNVSEETSKCGNLICLYDPDDNWDVKIFSTKSSLGTSPSVSVQVPADYIMTSGGYETNADWLHLIQGSYPKTKNTWEVISKNNPSIQSELTITAYAVGIKYNKKGIIPQIETLSGNVMLGIGGEPYPRMKDDYKLIGGGITMSSDEFAVYIHGQSPSYKKEDKEKKSPDGWNIGYGVIDRKDEDFPWPVKATAYAIGMKYAKPIEVQEREIIRNPS